MSARTPEKIQARNGAIAVLYADGATMQELGDMYGISRERVRQILSKLNVVSRPGAPSVLTDPIRVLNVCRESTSVTSAVRALGCMRANLLRTLTQLGALDEMREHWKQNRRHYTDGYLIAHLRVLALRLGRTPSIVFMNAAKGGPSFTTYVYRFGSWSRAVQLAGLEQNPGGRPGSTMTVRERLDAVILLDIQRLRGGPVASQSPATHDGECERAQPFRGRAVI